MSILEMLYGIANMTVKTLSLQKTLTVRCSSAAAEEGDKADFLRIRKLAFALANHLHSPAIPRDREDS